MPSYQRRLPPEPLGNLRRQLAFKHRGAGDHDARNARSAGARDDRFRVVVEARMREVGADVGQLLRDAAVEGRAHVGVVEVRARDVHARFRRSDVRYRRRQLGL